MFRPIQSQYSISARLNSLIQDFEAGILRGDMASVNNMATIFSAAGDALKFLGDLTMLLHSTPSSAAGKWNDEEMELLRLAVTRFGDHLRRLEQRINARLASEIKQTIKREEFEDAEIPYESTVNVQMSNETSDQETFEKSEIADAPFYERATRGNEEEEGDENDAEAAANPGFVGS